MRNKVNLCLLIRLAWVVCKEPTMDNVMVKRLSFAFPYSTTGLFFGGSALTLQRLKFGWAHESSFIFFSENQRIFFKEEEGVIEVIVT
mgnify:CR=1 FL=1